MSSAHIVANQAGLSAGQPSVSRRDLTLGVPVYLSNYSDDGVRSHRWRMVDRPSGSVAVITNKASAVSQFTPDLPGSYLIELQVDEAREGQVDRRVFAVLTDFGGLSPVPLRIPAAGEDNEANWNYDFGPTVAPNTRGWMPDFVELVLYAGILAGPAPALSVVLTVGNTTGGEDILLTAGDVLRGEPGAAANVIGGSGVNGADVNVQGANSDGPNGDGGDVNISAGAGMGTGVDGQVSLTGGSLSSIQLLSGGGVSITTPSGSLDLSSGAGLTELAVGDITRESTAGRITDTAAADHSITAAGASSRQADVLTDTSATTATYGAGTHMVLSAGGTMSATADSDLSLSSTTGTATLTAAATLTVQSGGAIAITSSGSSITETANGLHATSGTDVTREATAGDITDNASAAHTCVASTFTRTISGAITDTAGTTITLTAPTSLSMGTPSVILTTASAVFRGADGGAPTGFTVRAGDGSGGNTVGGALAVRSGNSVGSGAGTTLTLSPGDVVSGTRGNIRLTHAGPDTDEVEELATTGTNGAAVQRLVGTRNPSASAVSASCGDIYHRDDGSVGEAYIKSAGNGNTSGWHRIGNDTLFARSNVAQTVSATVTETTIVNFTVPGGSMGSNGTIRMVAYGTMLSTAVGATYTLRIKFGGTTVYQDVTPTIGASASSRAWCIDVVLANVNSTASQAGGGRVSVSATSAATTGVGALASSSTGGAVRLGTAAVDTTSDQSLVVTVEHSTSNAGTSSVRTQAHATISMH